MPFVCVSAIFPAVKTLRDAREGMFQRELDPLQTGSQICLLNVFVEMLADTANIT